MKRPLATVLFAAVLTLFSVTSAMAVDCPAAPGCPCGDPVGGPPSPSGQGVLETMENHANAMKVRDKAITRETVKQNDNSIGMTCFDQSLGVSARLGQIFSDVPATGTFPYANERVWMQTVYDDAFGVGTKWVTDSLGNPVEISKTLSDAYSHVISDMMQAHADDFEDSLSMWLGATALSWAGSAAMNAILALMAPLQGLITTIQGVIATIQTWMDNLITALDIINMILPMATPAAVNAINDLYWPQLKNFLQSAIEFIQNDIINMIVNQVTAIVMGPMGTLLGVDPVTGRSTNDPNEGECARISRLWDPGVQALVGDFRPIEGGGIETGTPYGTFMDLLQALAPGAGKDFLDEIQNAANSPILNAALNDLTGAAGALSGPGNMATWPCGIGPATPSCPAPPVFPVPGLGGAALSAVRAAL